MSRNNETWIENLSAAVYAVSAGNGIFVGLGLAAVAVSSWSRSRHSRSALDKIESTPVTPLADIKNIVDQDGLSTGSSYAGDHARSGEDGGGDAPSSRSTFAIVRGEVQPRTGWRFYGNPDDLPLRSEFAPDEAAKCVLTRKTQAFGHIELNGSFRVHEAPMSDLLKQVPFVLRDPRARDTGVYVDWKGSPKDWLPLECVFRDFQPGAASGTHAFIFLVFGRSCPVGVVTEERVLKVGTELTAVGHLSKSVDKGLSIRPAADMPFFMTRMTKDEIVEALRIEGLVYRWAGLVTGAVAGGLFAYTAGRFCFRLYKDWRRRQNLYRNPGPPPSTAGAAPRPSSFDGSATAAEAGVVDEADDVAAPGEACVICLTRTRRAVFLNCGHRAACVQCAQRVAEGQKICPLCRQAIVGVVRVYDP